MPFPVQDIKQVCRDCRVCTEVKPRFTKPAGAPLVKALRPFDLTSVDFKDPLPSQGKIFICFTVVDKYFWYQLMKICGRTTDAFTWTSPLRHFLKFLPNLSIREQPLSPSLDVSGWVIKRPSQGVAAEMLPKMTHDPTYSS